MPHLLGDHRTGGSAGLHIFAERLFSGVYRIRSRYDNVWC